jgi:hypothetical protein
VSARGEERPTDAARGGAARGGAGRDATPTDGPAVGETCDYCGSDALSWRKCKLICGNCSQINKSCADL